MSLHMLGTEYLAALWFYIVFSLFGLIGLPIMHRLLPSRTLAYATARVVGLVIFGYAVWLLASLHVLDYQNSALITIMFAIAVGTGAWHSRGFFKDTVDTPKKNTKKRAAPFYKKVLLLEAGIIALYLGYLFVRSHNAGANGTERFMDMMLLTAAGHTHSFPFADSWYAGKTVNYYYYGSYLMSLISNLAHIPYTLSYTFSLGLLYCQSVLLSASLVFTMTRSRIMAGVGAFLVTTAGTVFFAVATIVSMFTGHTYTYASSTRLYTPSYIINEIPSYSFTVGDLHAHMLALPFFILGLILLYALVQSKKMYVPLLAMFALSLATSGMINLWDLVTLASLVGVFALARMFVFRTSPATHEHLRWIGTAAAIIVGALVLMLPYLFFFKSPVLGIGFAPAFAAARHLVDVQYPTPFLAELGMWGVFVWGGAYALWTRRKDLAPHLFLIVLGIVSLGIIIGVEFLFIKDIYSVTNAPYFRANTTFKFGYHAWTCASIAFAVLMAMLMQKKGVRRNAAVALTAITVGAGLFYPYQAIKQFYGPNMDPVTLNALTWMKGHSMEDWATIQFINEHFTDRTIVAEAVGDSYSWYARIATFTGMITPMGWKSHEWTWRFDGKNAEHAAPGVTVETGWGPVSLVAQDIQTLYETPNVDIAHEIIQKYSIRYVYIGDMERTMYPKIQEEKFATMGTVVFQQNKSRLVEVR